MTSEREQFMKAICENPADDAPRLMYADWLTERGDPRGEFIRVQIARATLPKGDPQEAALRNRDLQLRTRHTKQWRAELPCLSGINWQRFWRGFVSGAEACRGKHFRNHAERIFESTPVQFLRISGGLSESQLPAVVGSPLLLRLRALELLCHVWTADMLRSVAECPWLANLETFRLTGSPFFHAYRLRRDFPFRGPPIPVEGLLALAHSPHLAQVSMFDLSGLNCGEEVNRVFRDRFGDRVRF